MTSKIRKQIYIDPQQEIMLKELATLTGISEAEIIRQAINRHIQSSCRISPNLEAWESETSYMEQLREKGSVPGQRSWRRSDLYER